MQEALDLLFDGLLMVMIVPVFSQIRHCHHSCIFIIFVIYDLGSHYHQTCNFILYVVVSIKSQLSHLYLYHLLIFGPLNHYYRTIEE